MIERDDLDRRLSAWLDGALSNVEAAEFEQEQQHNPALAERAASWRGNDRLIVDALSPIADEAIDHDMLLRMGLAGEAAAATAANDNSPWWRRRWLPVSVAIAASLAMMVLVQHPQAGSDDGGFSIALDTTPTLHSTKLTDGKNITPVLTARAGDGRWCREYRIDGRAGLACRSQNGWKVEAASNSVNSGNTGDYELAGGETDAKIDAANAQLRMSDPIDAAAEHALIGKGWNDR